jgi:hypothetical protein
MVTFSAECPIVIWQKPTLRWQKNVTYLEARTQMRRGLRRIAPHGQNARAARGKMEISGSVSLLQRRNIKVCDFSRSLTTSNFGLMRFFSSITSLSLDRHSWSSDLNTHIPSLNRGCRNYCNTRISFEKFLSIGESQTAEKIVSSLM